MIGGIDHVVEGVFGTGHLLRLLLEVQTLWPEAVSEDLRKGGPFVRPVVVPSGDAPACEFAVYRDQATKDLCDAQGVVEAVEGHMLTVLFHSSEISFVTGTDEAAETMGQNLCRLMERHP